MPALSKCMGVIIPSASQALNGAVTINLGAKGAVELELVASSEKWGRGPAKDLHSSQKARVDSPAWRLVAALQTLVTADGNTPAIEGWFEKVRPLTAREKELVAEVAGDAAHIAQNEADAKASAGVKRWIDDLDYRSSIERLVSQPTVNIQGLVAGYTGPGGKTILPGAGGGEDRPAARAQHDARGLREETARPSRQEGLPRCRGEHLGRI